MMNTVLKKKQRLIVIILSVLLIVSAIISIRVGYSDLTFNRIVDTLLGKGTFKEEFIVFSIRLPRIIITILAGMALALSGAILQTVTRNDLADPGIIGINAGAGVAIAIFFLFFPVEAGAFTYALPVVAFLGALITVFLIYLFSYRKYAGLIPTTFVLVGVGFALALSGLMVVLISSADREKVDFIAKWLAGNIWGTDWPFIWMLLPWLILLIPFALYKANRMNVLGLSDPIVIGIGVSLERERIVLIAVAVALASSAVAVTGGIAFIGLMAPHIAKALVGVRHQFFIPVAILMGAWLLLIADTIGRNLVDPDGIPAGVIVAFIGAPYFIYLLIRKQ